MITPRQPQAFSDQIYAQIHTYVRTYIHTRTYIHPVHTYIMNHDCRFIHDRDYSLRLQQNIKATLTSILQLEIIIK